MNDELNTLINEIEESTNKNESDALADDTESSSDDSDREFEAMTSSSTSKLSAADYANQQKEAWAKKIAMGKATLEDLESNPSTRWLVGDVKAKLGIRDSYDDLEQKLEHFELRKQFDKDKAIVKELPSDVKKQVVEMMKEFVEIGASPEKALRKALDKSKGLMEEIETTRKTRIEAGQIPSGKASGGIPTYTVDQIAKMSQEEYNKLRKLEQRGEVVIKL